MKHFIALAVFIVAFFTGAHAQLKTKADCGNLFVDIYKGWINEAKPNADPEQIKAKLPCFTSFEKEGNESVCGGGIYYPDKGMTAYTQRDYFVFTDKFKGKFSVPLMGAKQSALFAWLGNPKLKDANWEAYGMGYGTLIIYYNDKNVVNKVIMSTKGTDDIQLCDH
jgi:predicted oxidoreductase (fatty acid repression mutant protein)